MTKETVRFPDGLVDHIKEAVDSSDLFESRSEFHRVSSELLLDMLDPDHEPTNFSYRELRAEIEEEVGFTLDGSAAQDTGDRFLETYVAVRRRVLHGDLEGARELVAERYDPVSVEALLLDEVIGTHRSDGDRPEEGAGSVVGPTRRTADGDGPDATVTDGREPQEVTDGGSEGAGDGSDGGGIDPLERRTDPTDSPEPTR